MLWYMREGGWHMWLVLAFGIVALMVALLYLRNPRREMLPLIIGFGVVTVLVGCMGTALAFQATMHVPREEAFAITVGVRESLNNAVLAFGLTALCGLITTLGAYRAAVPARGALARA